MDTYHHWCYLDHTLTHSETLIIFCSDFTFIVEAMVCILYNNPNITKLDLSCNMNSNDSNTTFCEFMKNNTSLKELIMNKSSLVRDGYGLILEMLKINRTIEVIYIFEKDKCKGYYQCNYQCNLIKTVNLIEENSSIKVFNWRFCLCEVKENSFIRDLDPRLIKKIEETGIWE